MPTPRKSGRSIVAKAHPSTQQVTFVGFYDPYEPGDSATIDYNLAVGLRSAGYCTFNSGSPSVNPTPGRYLGSVAASPPDPSLGLNNDEVITVDTGARWRKVSGTWRRLVPIGVRKAQTLAANGALTLDFSLGSIQDVLLQANATSMVFSNPTDGQEVVVSLLEDATGGRTYAWPASVKWLTAAPNGTTASKRIIVKLYWDGTNWWEISRNVGVG